MYLPLGQYSPDVRLGFVSASRNCFPRALAAERSERLISLSREAGIELVVPDGECAIIETRTHAADAAAELVAAGVDAAVLFLGNFSPEIEDAAFVKAFPGPVLLIAAAEENAMTLLQKRGDALCGLLSAALAIRKRDVKDRVHIPELPVVSAEDGVAEIQHFEKMVKVVKGARNATLGLFGPRPRDFESCNYNLASIQSIGVEIEELGLFDLQNEIKAIQAGASAPIAAEQKAGMPSIPEDQNFKTRLSDYEQAIRNFRERLKLSGAASQCWSEQEFSLKHVPCFINGRMADKGFPIACENDAYSLVAELLAQYASDNTVTVLDINHSIPGNLHESLKHYPLKDMVGMFHCGNTAGKLLKNPEMKYQLIMKRLMEPDTDPDITRGTIEGQISASPITVCQVHGHGDKLRAYICEGHFLDLDPKTFGCTGTAYIPGFHRFYRHVLLGRYHHHAAVAFAHVGGVLYDAFKLLGIEVIDTPLPDGIPYPGENVFRAGLTPQSRFQG
jgi:L-fucose isomerase-like protein